jgi:hypothetical protein
MQEMQSSENAENVGRNRHCRTMRQRNEKVEQRETEEMKFQSRSSSDEMRTENEMKCRMKK